MQEIQLMHKRLVAAKGVVDLVLGMSIEGVIYAPATHASEMDWCC